MHAAYEHLPQTLRRIYDTVCAPHDAGGDLDILRDFVGAEHVVASTISDEALSWRACSRLQGDDLQRIGAIPKRREYRDLLTSLPPETVARQNALIPLQMLQDSEDYQRILKPLDGGLAALLYWRNPDGWTGVGVCRSLVQGRDFTVEEIQRIQLLTPHMKAIERLRRQTVEMGRALGAVQGALDAVAFGLVVLDDRERILFMNRQADRLISARDGLMREGLGLRCATPEASAALRAAVRMVSALDPLHTPEAGAPSPLAAARTRLSAPRAAPSRPLVVTVAPAGPLKGAGWDEDRGSVVLLIHDPDVDAQIGEADLMAVYGLTRREAQLAARLAHGDTVETAAARLGVVSGTARQYLKCVFDKIGVQRQADLVRRLLQACR